ncbi:DUF1566 domain-containing protein [Methylophilus sp. Leaf414]|uniref:Lcl C-terminal domain-containing protein n=1 Tax=Methylophilus sp. Leaf414 TaxID=1736371 RepID=UPI0006FBF2E7|nr:DUF1566 domain-containing protein [Methylophilus sp. Leaf414]KQT37541.1 hypothetical protein ASG24_00625 [Methylophilus sp. Leaf414]
MLNNNKTALVSAVLFGLFSSHSHAALTNFTSSGSEVVFSSASVITWTKDANLLGSMFNSQGFSTVVNSIIGAYSGSYSLSSADFHNNGTATWYGAVAFVNYLNHVSYAGSNQWRLPAIIDTGAPGCSFPLNNIDCGYNVDTSTGEMATLYYDELGAKAVKDVHGNYQFDIAGIPDTAIFDNEVRDIYWTSLQSSANPDSAWIFATDDGVQMDGYSKSSHTYVWAVTSALAAPVPEADSLAMLIAGLGLLGLMSRRLQSV